MTYNAVRSMFGTNIIQTTIHNVVQRILHITYNPYSFLTERIYHKRSPAHRPNLLPQAGFFPPSFSASLHYSHDPQLSTAMGTRLTAPRGYARCLLLIVVGVVVFFVSKKDSGDEGLRIPTDSLAAEQERDFSLDDMGHVSYVYLVCTVAF
jgi:hypothetical protein